MKYTRETFSGAKTIMCSNHITIVRFDYSYQEKKSTLDAIEKIMKYDSNTVQPSLRMLLYLLYLYRLTILTS